jgi:four helix bundle protein
MGTTSFTQLDVYKKTISLTRDVWRITEYFPRQQDYVLTAQMQRAVLSIGANIAEGYGRRSARDKAHFYTISKGSGEELLHYLIVSEILGYFRGDADMTQCVNDVCGMLRRLADRTLESS